MMNFNYQPLLDFTEESSNEITPKKMLLGYAWSFLGVLTMVTSLSLTQALNKSIPHSELNVFRFAAQFLITSPLLAALRKCDIEIAKPSVLWVALSTILLTSSSYTHYGAVYYLPLGTTSGTIRSLALIMNYVISCATKRTILWFEFIAVILSVSGVTMVTQPAFLFSASSLSFFDMKLNTKLGFESPCHAIVLTDNNSQNSTTTDRLQDSGESLISREEIIGYILCVASAVSTTLYNQLVNRRLSNVNIYVYNFWLCIGAIVISVCIMVATERPTFPTVNLCILFLFAHMFCAGLHNILLYQAYQIIDPVITSLILTLQIALTFILQYTLFSGLHPGHANALEMAGAVLIFVANALVPCYRLVD